MADDKKNLTSELNALDCISRQAAIDELMKRDKELRNINWYDKPFAEGECKGIDDALEIINALPSAQPEQDEWCTDCKEYDSEKHCCPRFNRVIKNALKDARPEIIRCGKCKHHEGETYCYERDGLWYENDYCSYAERKEQDDG